jgi:hypothetical protein
MEMASRCDRFTPREKAPGTSWIGGWMGPRAVLDDLGTEKKHNHYHRLQGLGFTARSESEFNLRTFGRTPWTGDQPDARPLPTQDNTTHIPGARFEPAIPVFERSKTVRALDAAATGTDKKYNIEYKNEKQNLKEYVSRLRFILNTQLSAKNKIQATGTFVAAILRYSFAVTNCHQEEIQKLDRRTRKMLTIHGQHHTRNRH